MTVPEPMIAGKIKRLLRGAVAFDRQGGLREERASAADLLHKLPSVGRKVEAIVRRDAVLTQRLGKAFDGAPIELDSGRRDERAISHALAIIEDDFIGLGRKRRDSATASMCWTCFAPFSLSRAL
jgi:hypothetical protein